MSFDGMCYTIEALVSLTLQAFEDIFDIERVWPWGPWGNGGIHIDTQIKIDEHMHRKFTY